MTNHTDLLGKSKTASVKSWLSVALCGLLATVIFVVDLALPLGVAVGVLYVVVVLYTLWLPQRGATIMAASVCTGLTLFGLAFSPPGSELWKVLADRFLSIFAIWVTAILSFQRKLSEVTLQAAHDELDRQVKDRTESLSQTNARLKQELIIRKQAEAKIRESEERFQAFMNHSPTVKFLKDWQGRYIYVNRQFEEKLKLPMADCLGKTDQQLFPPEIARIFTEHDREALKTGDVLETEETTLDEKGKVRSWLVMKFPVRSTGEQLLLGGVALDITSRKQTEETLRKREAELLRSQEVLQTLGRKLISAQEDERRRISRELHDDTNQRLAVLALTLQSTQQRFPESDPLHSTFHRLYEDVSSISDDIRRLAYQLHPSVLDDLGLKIALQSFVQEFIQWAKIPATFQAHDVPESVPQDIATCVYRLTQESLRNVARHARASEVAVALTGEKGGLRLSIIDNGKGFDLETVRADRRGLGLIGMQERVGYVNGTFTISAVPDNGTEIVVWVPLSQGDS